jgi:2-furoyl-CoA dehydrogenase large subunit
MAEERDRTDRKSGANASAVISVDPSGQVTLRLCSTPNGQGHATVAAQIVADALGLRSEDIDVITEIDTLTSAWSIASGNYSNRFSDSAIVVDAIAKSAEQVAAKIKVLAAQALDVLPEEIELFDGYARVRGHSNKRIPFRKAASRAHWDPAGLPDNVAPGILEAAFVSPPVLASPDAKDRIASAATFGFVIDVAAIEINAKTGALRIDRYASVHDVGTQLNPKIVEGQVHGGFVHGLGAALFEELTYDARGNFLAGTFADYRCPTAVEVPPVEIGHVETPSPINALGAKGMGDGSSMLTPAALANAVADALERDDISLPLNLQRLWALPNGKDATARPQAAATTAESAPQAREKGALTGSGEVLLSASVDEVWRRPIDPQELAAIVPGCQSLRQDVPDRYSAQVVVGVAGIRGAYDAIIEMRDKQEGRSVRLVGKASGALGFGAGSGLVTLQAEPDGCTRLYRGRPADARDGYPLSDQAVLWCAGAAHRAAKPQRLAPLAGQAAVLVRAARRRAVKPVAFDYHRPQTVSEALALVSDMREEAAVLAGGMTLGPMLDMRLVRPRAVIDISRIQALKSITVTGNVVVTGGGVVQRDALRSDVIGRELPLLAMALPWVGHFQTRNRGTLGGSAAARSCCSRAGASGG